VTPGSNPGRRARAWLGVDLGTQGCRVAVVDDTGCRLGAAEAPLSSRRPAPGRHEQDPAAWKSAVSAACQQVVAGLGGRPIAGLAICGTSGTLLLVDRGGLPLAPALMYDDARAAAELRPIADAWAACAGRNGYRIQPTWALPKLAWMVRHVEGAAGGRLAHVPDFVASWLVGATVATDTSHALKTGYDLVAGRWPEDAFEAVGIPPARASHASSCTIQWAPSTPTSTRLVAGCRAARVRSPPGHASGRPSTTCWRPRPSGRCW
jgi:D-ribulokinase